VISVRRQVHRILSTDSAYRENSITNNITGTVTGGLNMFSNSCNGNTLCP